MKSKLIKILLGIIFILIESSNSNAQNFIRYGVKLGTNYSLFAGPDKPAHAITPWLLDVGAYYEYALTDYSSIWLEPGFVQRGVKIIEPLPYLDNSQINIYEKNNYFTLPIYFNLRQGDDFLSSFAGVGAEFEFLAQKKRTMYARINNLKVEPKNYYNFDPHRLNYGFIVGGGVKLMGVMITGKFYTSLQNLYRGRDIREIRYNTFTVSMIYQINRPQMRTYTNGRNSSFKNKFKYTYFRVKKRLRLHR